MSYRIGERRRILELLKTGRVYDCPLFKLHYLLSSDGAVHVAVSVGRAQGNAVVRNRVRRRVREGVRIACGAPFDMLVRVKRSDIRYVEVVAEMHKLEGVFAGSTRTDRSNRAV